MKKNLFLALALSAAFAVTSCDQTNTSAQTVATEEPALHADHNHDHVQNPNVVPTAESATSSANAPVLSFKETEYDFGTIKQGEVVEHVFEFTNTGNSPLVIENAAASCGCTAPEWTQTPVAPGETGKVRVQFNSTGKVGQQSPIVTITANTEPNITRISMKGNVESNAMPTAGADGPVRRN